MRAFHARFEVRYCFFNNIVTQTRPYIIIEIFVILIINPIVHCILKVWILFFRREL